MKLMFMIDMMSPGVAMWYTKGFYFLPILLLFNVLVLLFWITQIVLILIVPLIGLDSVLLDLILHARSL